MSRTMKEKRKDACARLALTLERHGEPHTDNLYFAATCADLDDACDLLARVDKRLYEVEAERDALRERLEVAERERDELQTYALPAAKVNLELLRIANAKLSIAVEVLEEIAQRPCEENHEGHFPWCRSCTANAALAKLKGTP